MSDETKGATVMVQGCRHDNVTLFLTLDGGVNIGGCDDCPALINMEAWRKLRPPPEPAHANHCPRCAEEKAAPPPEPPKSWVDSKSDGDPGKKGLMRETVEECCRVLEQVCGLGRHTPAEMRRAMLEPKE